ncbi:MAG: class I SAM-dependent methyltransferase [Verrucomicrobiaceae bacterium]|jgi:ubiquinone/menaquinone biosynthesis C-methylase UbiE|nr:class I SAM-dependent methyltransferase [Verrucomicrobiaceae bacterium]
MIPSASFEQKSYRRHAEHYNEHVAGGPKEALAKTWFSRDTVNAWRHDRFYQLLDPVLHADQKTRWLTVGDGRYGTDAHMLMERGCEVVASDISDVLLREAKEQGYISEFRTENAEALSFGDGEFDYVFCKESYHHFPRPMKALYEMVRVARKGVFLIEPNDVFVSERLLTVLCRKIKGWLGRVGIGRQNRHAWEASGNYVYSLSRREMEKAALGLNFRAVAFKGINDLYLPKMENELLSEKGPLQKRLRRHLQARDLLCKIKVFDYTNLGVLILKDEPSQELLDALAKDGFEVLLLPCNPHLA